MILCGTSCLALHSLPRNVLAHAAFFCSIAVSVLAIMAPPDALESVMDHTPGESYCSAEEGSGCCNYETVDAIGERIFPRVQELVQTPFFSFYKIDLQRGCPFWNDDLRCTQEDCSVHKLDESDVPEEWRSETLGAIDLSPVYKGALFAPPKAVPLVLNEKDFCVWDDVSAEKGVYVNLLNNPERFTGYSGSPAHQIWKAIYDENCFGLVQFQVPEAPNSAAANSATNPSDDDDASAATPATGFTPWKQGNLRELLSSLRESPDAADGVCIEKKVFYRILSGLHASISIHLCDNYLDQTTGKWYSNLDCFIERIGYYPERLQSLYFDYVILLRALTKAGPFLEKYDYCTGDIAQDSRIKQLVHEIATTTMNCPDSFDERMLFQNPTNRVVLKQQFKDHFRNISRIMDCVGCEKCRLWGKIQVSGMATALKVLFSFEDHSFTKTNTVGLDPLRRSEIVALFNTFARVSESLNAVERFRTMYKERRLAEMTWSDRVKHSMSSVVDAFRERALEASCEVARVLEQNQIPIPFELDPRQLKSSSRIRD